MAYVEQDYENKSPGAVHDGQYPAKYDGVYGDCPPAPQIDVASIPPNNPRPSEGGNAEHLFGTWSD